jgi:hypothetical protein
MIDQVTTVSLRGQRQRDRLDRLRAAVPPGIRVTPRDDDMRRVLRHPTAGGFRAEGSALWPSDRFTKRRLADGTVTRDEPRDEPQEKTPEQGTSYRRRPPSPPSSGDA